MGCKLPTNEPVKLSERHSFTGAAPTGDQTHSEWALRKEIQNPGQSYDEDHNGRLPLRWTGLDAGTQRDRTSTRASRSSKVRLGPGQKGQTKWARARSMEQASKQQAASQSLPVDRRSLVQANLPLPSIVGNLLLSDWRSHSGEYSVFYQLPHVRCFLQIDMGLWRCGGWRSLGAQ